MGFDECLQLLPSLPISIAASPKWLVSSCFSYEPVNGITENKIALVIISYPWARHK